MMSRNTLTLEFTRSDETAYALVASPHFPVDRTCFAACSSGLYRSRDGGCSWDLLSGPATAREQLAVTAVAVSPQFPADRAVFAAVKGGIQRSSDGGDTWFTAGFAAPPPLFTALSISPNYELDGLMFAGSLEDGVFSSTDRGIHWNPWNFGLFDLGVLSLALSPKLRDDETVFAGTETGLYRSTNGGRAWRVAEFPEACAPVLCLAAVENPQTDELTVFAGTESHGLMFSPDSGVNWQRAGQSTISGAVNQLQVTFTAEGGTNIFALAEQGVWRSPDMGQNWEFLMQSVSAPTAMLLPDENANIMLLGIHGKGVVRQSY